MNMFGVCVYVLILLLYPSYLQEHDPQTIAELQELYSSLFPAFSDAVPDVFDPNIFTFEALLWADNVLNSYSLSNPLVIVPM